MRIEPFKFPIRDYHNYSGGLFLCAFRLLFHAFRYTGVRFCLLSILSLQILMCYGDHQSAEFRRGKSLQKADKFLEALVHYEKVIS